MQTIEQYARYTTFLLRPSDIKEGKATIQLTESHADIFNACKKNGSDLVIFAGTTKAEYEIKSFNWVAHEAEIEVQVPESTEEMIRINVAYDRIAQKKDEPKKAETVAPVETAPETHAEEKPRSKRESKKK